VIAEAIRRSPLADYADRFSALAGASRGDLAIHEFPFVTQVNLRADPEDAGLMQRLAAELGFSLPVIPNTVGSHGERRALWLAPDEWLIVGLDDQREMLDRALREGLADAFGSIVDVSANRLVLEIRGGRARDLLAHGVAIDLDPRSFGPRRCAQTLLAKTQVIIESRDESAFHIFTRISFACYLADFLLDAAAGISLAAGGMGVS
jgi:sarcosine oxidase subunit gamma